MIRAALMLAALLPLAAAAQTDYPVDPAQWEAAAAADAAVMALDADAPCALGVADVLLIEAGAEPTRIEGPATLTAADGARLNIQAGSALVAGGPIRAGGTAADCSAAMAVLVQWAQSRIDAPAAAPAP
jgi:hypothetical protein